MHAVQAQTCSLVMIFTVPVCFKARTGEGSGVEETGDLTVDSSSNISTLSKASSNYSKVSEPGETTLLVLREREKRERYFLGKSGDLVI